MSRRDFLIGSAAVAGMTTMLAEQPIVAAPAAVYAQISTSRIAEIERELSSIPRGFGPDYHNRQVYTTLAERSDFAAAVTSAEDLLTQTFPAWDDNAYLDFSRTGERPRGEKMMIDRQNWLQPLVWAECIENESRFTATINSVLREIAVQKSWTLPAHDAALTSFDGTAYFVELNSASLAHSLAQALYMLDDKVSASVRQDVMDSLYKRIFDPMMQSYVNGKGHWWLYPGTNNWNAVCLSGVTGAALTVIASKFDRAVFSAAAEHYSQNFVASYLDDGYCTEGLGYFNYGFGDFVLLRESLWQAASGKVDLFDSPKVRRMALYGPTIQIVNGECPAIGDCRFGTKIDSRMNWYCSRNLGLAADEDLPSSWSSDFSTTAMFTFPNSAEQTPNIPVPANDLPLRTYFEDAEVLICRPLPGGLFGAALAAGNNGKSHNHNDVGSFSVVSDTNLPISDPGGPLFYNADTFGPLRYTKFQLFRSRTHPVPVVGGFEQKAGKEYAAKVLDADFTDARDTLKLDLSGAYDQPFITSLLRTFMFNRSNGGSLIVIDEFAFADPRTFEMSLETHGEWSQSAPGCLLFQLGASSVLVSIDASAGYGLAPEQISEGGVTFTRLGIVFNQPAQSGKLTITLRPQNPAA